MQSGLEIAPTTVARSSACRRTCVSMAASLRARATGMQRLDSEEMDNFKKALNG